MPIIAMDKDISYFHPFLVSLQQPLSDIPSDSSSVTSNKENAPPPSGNTGNEIPPMSAMSNMLGSTSVPATTASVQPLPSNMVNKTSFQMETQYMQQQSQIFVFSTALANKAAESYLTGQFPSIIAFHCAQPGTKSFLEVMYFSQSLLHFFIFLINVNFQP
ncbi:BCL9 domain-containing protein [Trichonephila clavipes]|nr:BCL9 domain-containing protein [Trichonephila clavipes]